MDLTRAIDIALAAAAVISAVAIVFLLPLYLSQRRDVRRLRAWMAREPEHPASDLRASEAMLDRAEAELERLAGADEEAPARTEVRPPPAETAAGLSSAAARVTSERPALERITMERAALEPHPRWRRFSSRATQPKVLAAIGALAVILAGGAIFGALNIPLPGEEDRPRFDPSEVTVSVLNGTSVSGLAGQVEADVAAGGYRIDTVGGTESGYERTVVMYREGERRAARRIAADLEVRDGDIEALEPEIAQLAGDADVVVIAGEDRA